MFRDCGRCNAVHGQVVGLGLGLGSGANATGFVGNLTGMEAFGGVVEIGAAELALKGEFVGDLGNDGWNGGGGGCFEGTINNGFIKNPAAVAGRRGCKVRPKLREVGLGGDFGEKKQGDGQ